MTLMEVLHQPITYLFSAVVAGIIHGVARAATGTLLWGTPAKLMRDHSGRETLVSMMSETETARFRRRRTIAYRTRLIGTACAMGVVIASAACEFAHRLLLHSPTWLLIVLFGAALAVVICGERAAKREVILLGGPGEAKYVVRKLKQR